MITKSANVALNGNGTSSFITGNLTLTGLTISILSTAAAAQFININFEDSASNVLWGMSVAVPVGTTTIPLPSLGFIPSIAGGLQLNVSASAATITVAANATYI